MRGRVTTCSSGSLLSRAPPCSPLPGTGTCPVLSQDLEWRVVPLQDVGVRQVTGGEGPPAEGADVSMQSVVVVLTVFQGAKHLAAAGRLTGELSTQGLLGSPAARVNTSWKQRGLCSKSACSRQRSHRTGNGSAIPGAPARRAGSTCITLRATVCTLARAGLEKTPESPLDSKEIKPVNPKGNQP